MNRPPLPNHSQPAETDGSDRLDSWKEIAAHLKRGVRAVQRWEREEGLPIHRHLHKKLGSVYAFKRELDDWWRKRPAPGALRKSMPVPGESGHNSIAVLPFVNMSPDKENEYFSDGMTEELISALARIEGIRVASRTSVFRFKNKPQNVRDIGKELNVGAVLEGSVRKAEGRLRITAQLIDVAAGHHIWSETYERKLKDVFAVQNEISRALAERLKIRLLDKQANLLVQPSTKNIDAYTLYLKGRHYWNQRTGEGFRKCIQCFEEAIERDPDYVVAYAGLADGYNTLGYYNYLAPKDAFPKAKAAALSALRRDDTLAEAHTALAFSKMFYDWDWKGAETEFRRALRLREDYAIAHYWYGLNLASLGQPYDAIAQVRRAQQLDPLSPVIGAYVAGGYYFARQYDLAIEKCRQTLDLEPNFALARLVIGWALRQKSMFREAVAEFKKAVDSSKGSADGMAALGHAYGVWGKKSEAERILGELTKTSKTSHVSPGHFAMVYLGLGEKDAAFHWLQRAREERYAWLVFLKMDPIFDSLHSDPRFEKLLAKMGLA
ncbi:MAG TPA: guanylate cyclase [Acidobacteriota bacterium]